MSLNGAAHPTVAYPILMMKLSDCPPLFVPLQVSTALGAGLPEQRAKNEWIEGVAIWAAVFIVSGVGEWRWAAVVERSGGGGRDRVARRQSGGPGRGAIWAAVFIVPGVGEWRYAEGRWEH